MGNLVTTGLQITGPDADLTGLLRDLTGSDPVELLERTRAAPGLPVWVDLAPWRGVPEPDLIRNTQDGSLTDLGLAVLSRDGTDHFRLKQGRDPFLAAMPPEFSETAEGLLRRHGIDRLRGEKLQSAAEARLPGCIEAGRAAIAAYEGTGEFSWYDWRKRHWGARAFGEELRVETDPEGSLRLRFDSVNDCPIPLLRTLLSRHPGLALSGASLDEDAGEAILLATDEGELILACSDEEEELTRAHQLIYGEAPEEESPEP